RVRVKVVRPCVVVAAIPTEQNDSVGLRIIRHGMISSYTRAHNRGQVRPRVRLEVVGPRVAELLSPCTTAEQQKPVGLSFVRHLVSSPTGLSSVLVFALKSYAHVSL